MCPVRAGQIIFEIVGPSALSFKALKRASKKLPCKCVIVALSF
jgi:ribosomal protein L16/L10AE